MKLNFFLILWLFLGTFLHAQIESTSSIKIGDDNNFGVEKYSLSKSLSTPKNDFPLYSRPKELEDYGRNKKSFSMIDDNGFLDPNIGLTPKWFTKDKEIKEEYKSDQYLGDFKSEGKFVNLVYRDHQYVDGDIVRIYINDDVLRPRVYLTGSFEGVKINLEKGFNKIDIQALNQGESGPNTAEFHLYDDQGNLITGNEWNLTTGVKATLIVVKENE